MTYQPTYMITAKISDFTESIYVNFAREHGTALMGKYSTKTSIFNRYFFRYDRRRVQGIQRKRKRREGVSLLRFTPLQNIQHHGEGQVRALQRREPHALFRRQGFPSQRTG